MSNGRTAFIVVDAQLDYLPDGACGFPGSDANLEALAYYASTVPEIVIASRNLRPTGSHLGCVKGTKGAQLIPDIDALAMYKIAKSLSPQDGGFSAFEGGTLRPLEKLEDILKREEISHVIVGGWWLEECVAYTAFDANALGYKTWVETDASMSLDGSKRAETITKLKRAGVVCA